MRTTLVFALGLLVGIAITFGVTRAQGRPDATCADVAQTLDKQRLTLLAIEGKMDNVNAKVEGIWTRMTVR